MYCVLLKHVLHILSFGKMSATKGVTGRFLARHTRQQADPNYLDIKIYSVYAFFVDKKNIQFGF
jgi:hypothetical protein